MNNQDGLILWVGGFSGGLLLYSAFTNKPILKVFSGGVTKINDTTAPKKPVSTRVPGTGETTLLGNPTTNNVTVPAAYRNNPATYLPMGA